MQGQIMTAMGMDFVFLSLCFKSHGKPLKVLKQDSDMICSLFVKFPLKILWKMGARVERENV